MSLRNSGLLQSTLRVEVEDVRTVHKKVCAHCARVPTILRMLVTAGGGRNAVTHVYCRTCAAAWIDDRRQEYAATQEALLKGVLDAPLRLKKQDQTVPWPPIIPPEVLEARAARKEAKARAMQGHELL